MKEIVFIVLNRLHKILSDPHRNICLCHFLKVCLQVDKLFHIRMGTVNGDHQRSPAPVLSDERGDQRVQFHKRDRTARLLRRIVDLCSPGAQF